MAKFIVSESKAEGCRKIEVDYDFGSNLDEAVEKFGADVVFSGFQADGKVAVQAMVRRMLNTNKEDGSPYTDEEIFAKVAEYKLGIRADRGSSDPMAKVEKVLGKLTDAQKAEFLEKLKALI